MRYILAALAALPLCVLAQEPQFDVTLIWTAPTENTDGTPLTDLAGYRIYWGVTEGSYPNMADVGLPAENEHVMTDTTLLDDTEYFFVATAYDDDGLESAFSNPVSTTTPDATAPGPPSDLSVTITLVTGVE